MHTNKELSDRSNIASSFESDKYHLLEKIGEGGFGQIYKARHLVTKQFVAIKILTLSQDFEEDKKQRHIARFEREALLGSELQHPNIVRLLDKGNCNDILFAVFEYINGQNLKERLSENGPLSPVETAEIMGQVLDAITHAHDKGIIHRDIKPANIMLTKTGAKTHAMVLDFGIGIFVSNSQNGEYNNITFTQEMVCTPSYSAPEQLRGEPPTPKTDLYVWGLVFIECLTGWPAVNGDTVASVFFQQLSQDSIPIPAVLNGHAVEPLLRRVLSKKSNERAASGANIYRELSLLNFDNLVSSKNNNVPRLRKTLPSSSVGDTTQLNTSLVDQGNIFAIERKKISILCLSFFAKVGKNCSLDSDTISALLRDQINHSTDTAVNVGAHASGRLANTIMFYFGFPISYDMVDRTAGSTALDISVGLSKRNLLNKDKYDIQILASISLHSGDITIRSGSPIDGETVNVAMSMLRYANPGDIICSDTYKSSVKNIFEFKPNDGTVETYENQSIQLFNLTGEYQLDSFSSSNVSGNLSIIGRKDELKKIVDICKNTNSKKERLVNFIYLFGEAGIGKSKLLQEAEKQLNKQKIFVTQCLPENINSSLSPILDITRNKLGLNSISSTAAVSLIQKKIGFANDLDNYLMVMCTWFDLPIPNDINGTICSLKEQKYILFNALTHLLLDNDDRENKNIFVIEDIQWLDATSKEFISQLNRTASKEPSNAVFIMTSRENSQGDSLNIELERINLSKLCEKQSAILIGRLFDGYAVSKFLMNTIINRTEGIPLFIIEYIEMLKVKSYVKNINGVFEIVDRHNVDELPYSLAQLIQSKINIPPHAKKIAQIASVIGREFKISLLAQANFQTEPDMLEPIEMLENMNIIEPLKKTQQRYYKFSCELYRQYLCETMDETTLRKCHKVVADALEKTQDKLVFNQPDVIAQHYQISNCFEKEIVYRLKSAKQSLEIGDFVHLYDTAIDALRGNANLPNSTEKQETEFLFNCYIIIAVINDNDLDRSQLEYIANHSYTIANVLWLSFEFKGKNDTYTRNPNAEKSNSFSKKPSKNIFHCFHILAQYFNHVSRRLEARVIAERMYVISEFNQSRHDEVISRAMIGQCYFYDANFELAKNNFEISLSVYDDQLNYDELVFFNIPTKITINIFLLKIYWVTGNTYESETHKNYILNYIKKYKSMQENANLNLSLAQIKQLNGDHNSTLKLVNQYLLRDVELRENTSLFYRYCCIQKWCNVSSGNVSSPNIISNSLYSKDIESEFSYYIYVLVDTLIQQGYFVEAQKIVRKGIKNSLKIKETCYLSRLYRLSAVINYHLQGHTQNVSEDFAQAEKTARWQKAKLFEFEAVFYCASLLKYKECPRPLLDKLDRYASNKSPFADTQVYRAMKKWMNGNAGDQKNK